MTTDNPLLANFFLTKRNSLLQAEPSPIYRTVLRKSCDIVMIRFSDKAAIAVAMGHQKKAIILNVDTDAFHTFTDELDRFLFFRTPHIQVTMKKIRILITDDHTLLRETWTFILSLDPRFDVVANCGTAEEAIALAQELQPDVVILDINLPGMSGLDATSVICASSTSSRVLGVSLHTHAAYARKMIQNGASGYVTKSSSRQEMSEAIVAVYRGETYICRDLIKSLNGNDVAEDPAALLHSLSKREMQVIKEIRQGFSSREIAAALNIKVKTVEVHRYNILRKLKLKNAAALVNYINHSAVSML